MDYLMPESSRLARAFERRRGADTRVCSAETFLGATGREDQGTIPAGNVFGGRNQESRQDLSRSAWRGRSPVKPAAEPVSGDGVFARMTTLEGLNCAGGEPVLDFSSRDRIDAAAARALEEL